MRIGVVREVSPDESRVSLTPHAVNELTRAGHRVTVEAGAGAESSLSDDAYREAGAVVADEAAEVYESSELMVKVYGPTPEECVYLKESSILLSFLSLPINKAMMRSLLDSRCVAFASESIKDGNGRLPVLTPMSEIAGRLVPQIGAHYLQKQSGGRGILLGGAVGVR
ncbi:MAG: alanine dehydrogenase, partial [Rubrobacter sp.]|nr:alanine dehydrogenase [Rubrobacter sp.]